MNGSSHCSLGKSSVHEPLIVELHCRNHEDNHQQGKDNILSPFPDITSFLHIRSCQHFAYDAGNVTGAAAKSTSHLRIEQ